MPTMDTAYSAVAQRKVQHHLLQRSVDLAYERCHTRSLPVECSPTLPHSVWLC